jgi:uncharacterized protein YjbJ (UPF0337 family)
MSKQRRESGVVEKIAGKVKEKAGAVIGNEELEREGRLEQQRVDAEKEAARREERAEQAAAEADVEAEKRDIAVERRELAAEVADARLRDEAEQARKFEKQRITDQLNQRERVIEAQNRAEERAVQQDRVEAVRDHARTAAEAAEAEREARKAELAAEVLDAAQEKIADTEKTT